MKSCYVLWSAGLDSTYLILRLLESGFTVGSGYVCIQNNSKKSKMELQAIENLQSKIKEIYKNFYYNGVIYSGRNNCVGMKTGRHLRYRQVPYFIHAFMVAPHTDYRALGYVKGDSAIKNLEKIRAVYNVHNLITFKVLPKLVFPIKNISKTEIYQHLQTKYPNILADCVWCEAPKGRNLTACGECTPCKRHSKELSPKKIAA